MQKTRTCTVRTDVGGGVPGEDGTPPVDEVIQRIRRVSAPSALNIYDEVACVAAGDPAGRATRRLDSLRRYLVDHWDAPVVLVGEAPGKHGARLSGVPFTSPRILDGSGRAEPSATIVHRALAELGVERQVLLWNASVVFREDNRDPLADALDASRGVLELVTRGRTAYALGRHAERATGAPYVRHPSMAGAPGFIAGLRVVFGSPPGTDIRAALRDLERAGRPRRPRRRAGRSGSPARPQGAGGVLSSVRSS
jgi:hypothetical protein